MKKQIYCLLAALCLAISATALPGSIKPLNIGDAVPDILLTRLSNYKKPAARLSDFRGKLLILDFWSTWCDACIDAMPHVQELQQRFQQKLAVIMVNSYPTDDALKVKKCLDKRKLRTGFTLQLPYCIQQTTLAAYFPHRFVPHYVWIDANGRLLAITPASEVTAENISAILDGKAVNMHTKNDLMEFNRLNPLFVNGNGGSESPFIYRSIFTGYREGIGSSDGFAMDSSRLVSRVYMVNYSPLMMLQTAYPEAMNRHRKLIHFEHTDSSKFAEGLEQGKSRYANSYCYELYLPPCSEERAREWVRKDMTRLLVVEIRLEKRNIPCLMLRAGSRPALSKGGIENEEFPVLQHISAGKFTDVLQALPVLNNIMVINESDIRYPFDIVFPPTITDINALLDFLTDAGFNAEQTSKELEVAVISGK